MLYLEFARRELGLSQAALSEKTRIHQRFISQIESEEGWPTPDQLKRLARALNLPPELVLKHVEVAEVVSPKRSEATV